MKAVVLKAWGEPLVYSDVPERFAVQVRSLSRLSLPSAELHQ